MGYSIKVDYNKLREMAKKIDDYNKRADRKMHQANSAIDELCANWQGSDAHSFKAQWDKVNASGSSYDVMRKSLKNYAEYLRTAAARYQSAQVEAINLASKLHR